MSTTTTVPTAVTTDNGNWSRTGGTTKWGVLGDASDSTYLSVSSINEVIAFHFGTAPTLPAGAVVTGLTVTGRFSSASTDTFAQATTVYALKSGTTQAKVKSGLAESYALDSAPHNASSVTFDRMNDGTLINDLDLTTLDVACVDLAVGTPDGTQILYELGLTWTYNEVPTVTVGSITNTTSLPTIPWTYADADSDTQDAYRVMIFTSTATDTAGHQVNTASFVPEFTTAATGLIWDSGKTSGSASSRQVGKGMADDTTYYAYVRVWQAPMVGKEMASTWAKSAMQTIAVTPPANPTITTTATTSGVSIDVEESATTDPHPAYYGVERSENSGDWTQVRNANLEGASVGWRFLGVNGNTITSSAPVTADTPGTLWTLDALVRLPDWTPVSSTGYRCIIERGTSTGNDRSWLVGIDPTGKIQLMASSDGTSYGQTATSTAAVPFADGAEGWIRVTWASFMSICQFYTSTNGTSWSQLGSNVAVTASFNIRQSTAGYTIGRADGDTNTQLTGLVRCVDWTNYLGQHVAVADLRGHAPKTTSFVDPYGHTWTWNTTGVTGSYEQMGLVITDAEVTPGVSTIYRARAWRDDTEVSAGAWVQSTPAVTVPAGWWLKDPLDSTLNMTVGVRSMERTRSNPAQVGYALGAVRALVTSSGIKQHQLQVQFYTGTRTAYDALMALLDTNHTLLLQSAQSEQWYVRLADSVAVTVVGVPTAGSYHYEVEATFAEVDPPVI